MIFEMWWALNDDFLCLIVKLTDFCVFHSQCFKLSLFQLVLGFFSFCFSLFVLSFFVLEVLKRVYLIEEMLMVQELNKEVYQIEETQDGSGVVDDKEGADVILSSFFVLFLIFCVIDLNLVMLCCKLIYNYEYIWSW